MRSLSTVDVRMLLLKNTETVAMEVQQGVFFLVVSPLSLPTCERHAGLLCCSQILIFLTGLHNVPNINLKAYRIRADTCGQKDVHDEANVLFSIICERA
jgi:hypothetical protein